MKSSRLGRPDPPKDEGCAGKGEGRRIVRKVLFILHPFDRFE
jgi:hypothetical protein